MLIDALVAGDADRAVALMNGHLQANLGRALAASVVLREDPALTALVPKDRRTRIAITLTDGTVFSAEVSGGLGDFDWPYDRSLLRDKFRALVPPGHRGLYDEILAIGDWPSLAAMPVPLTSGS